MEYLRAMKAVAVGRLMKPPIQARVRRISGKIRHLRSDRRFPTLPPVHFWPKQGPVETALLIEELAHGIPNQKLRQTIRDAAVQSAREDFSAERVSSDPGTRLVSFAGVHSGGMRGLKPPKRL